MKRIAVLLLMTFVTSCFFSVSESLAVPLPPEMSLEKTGISVEITWTPSVGADGYRLYYAAYPYTGPTSIGSVDVGNETEASYTLWEGASYYVAVTAYDETGESRSNSELFLLGPYTTDHAEGTPELTIDTDALEVSTSWTEVTGATSYLLYYAPYPFTALDAIGNFDMSDSTEADFTLWDGAAFYVAVTAVENGNESGYSNVELLLTGNPVPEWQNTDDTDTDGDGYSLDEGDCNDAVASINPGATEVCGDGIDQDCSGRDLGCVPVTLAWITITGGTQVNEGGTLQLTATATWSDGTTTNVTSSATWSEISSIVNSVSNGLVTAGQVSSDHTATITASFSSGGIRGTADHSITVKQVIPPNNYTENGNGTVTDNVTGLVWQQSADDQERTWQTAIDYCNDLTLGGSSRWRLPSINELETIIDPLYVPSINPIFSGPNLGYWSSTTSPSIPPAAWSVMFFYGDIYSYQKNGSNYARCVR